ncbi:MAG: hypothetical protein IJ007_04165, partial [Oscillospiraceae bacterium]|nr:hypothetical protein [Oscillospiraceae bacterium]
MLYKIEMITDYKQIYDYYNKVKNTVPYWFEADYDIWKQSFADDTDYDGEKMFKELVTYAAYSECRIVGFVQVGISDYVYNENGEKDHSIKGGIIRNIYWDKEHSCGEQLVSLADDFFKEKSAERLFAFFHAFGMTCNAGHGKLYCKLPYIEKVLIENGYVKEHENVYYKRKLTNEPVFLNENVSVEYGEVSEKGLCEFKIN